MISRWLGHSSPTIALDYDVPFMPEVGSKGRGAFDGLPGERGDRLIGRHSPDSPQGHRPEVSAAMPQRGVP
ncbi:integrase [Streptomyces rhizosphaericola]|uniref:Integrase n=1 Tax=Streptomyces rhizosphaericola TaxID=2564098 RepID=A0ABY2PI46_9ACTN|nr:integrase [Streptomyces rhizosphaericola]